MRYRIIADHSRTAAILIGDGVSPGQRRTRLRAAPAAAAGRSARPSCSTSTTPIVGELMATVRDAMGPSYPELVVDFDRINRIAVAEETAFNRTLAVGLAALRGSRGHRHQGIRCLSVLSGSDAFTLHDTYGFPIELTLEMAAESGLAPSTSSGFREPDGRAASAAPKPMPPSRKHAHADLTAYRELVDAGAHRIHRFRRTCPREATILGIFVDGRRVPVVAHGTEEAAGVDRVELVLDRTPLYAESGGQVADVGHHQCVSPGPARPPGRPLPTCRRSRKPCGCIASTWSRGSSSKATPSSRPRRRLTGAKVRDPRALRHAHGARRAATSIGTQRCSGWVAEPAGLPAIRLQLAGSADRRAARPRSKT